MISCSLCDKRSPSVETLEFHVTVDHLHWIPFQCTVCKTSFIPTRYFLKRHFAKQHPRAPLIIHYAANETNEKELSRVLAESCAISGVEYRPTEATPSDADKDSSAREECGSAAVSTPRRAPDAEQTAPAADGSRRRRLSGALAISEAPVDLTGDDDEARTTPSSNSSSIIAQDPRASPTDVTFGSPADGDSAAPPPKKKRGRPPKAAKKQKVRARPSASPKPKKARRSTLSGACEHRAVMRLIYHQLGDPERALCGECGKAVSAHKGGGLQSHVYWHFGQCYSCSNCGVQKSTKQLVAAHIAARNSECIGGEPVDMREGFDEALCDLTRRCFQLSSAVDDAPLSRHAAAAE